MARSPSFFSSSCVSFNPQFLADAIGSTLRLIDGLSPVLVTDPSRETYCVLMPGRCVAESVTEDVASNSPVQTMAA